MLYPKQKCIDYMEKWPFMVILPYNLYIFVYSMIPAKVLQKWIDYIENIFS